MRQCKKRFWLATAYVCVCVGQKFPSCVSLSVHAIYVQNTRAERTCTLRRRRWRRREGGYKRGYVAVIRNCVKSCTTTTSAGPNNEGCYAVCAYYCVAALAAAAEAPARQKSTERFVNVFKKRGRAHIEHTYTHPMPPPPPPERKGSMRMRLPYKWSNLESDACASQMTLPRDKMII